MYNLQSFLFLLLRRGRFLNRGGVRQSLILGDVHKIKTLNNLTPLLNHNQFKVHCSVTSPKKVDNLVGC